MTKVIFYPVAIAAVLSAGVFTLAGTGGLLSLVCGGLAAILPQTAMLALARHRRSEAAFSLWAGKFSLTILLLAVAARLLHQAELMTEAYFIGGAVLAVAFNITLLARLLRTA